MSVKHAKLEKRRQSSAFIDSCVGEIVWGNQRMACYIRGIEVDENGQEMYQFRCVENCQCLTFLPSFQFLSWLFPAQTWECCALVDEVAQARLHYVERCPPLAARAHAREEADVEIKIAWEVGDAGTELDLSLMHLRRYTCHNHQLLLEICLSMHERLL